MLPVLSDAAAAVAWLRARVPAGARLSTDSRRLRAGDAFLAWPGAANDARGHVGAALAAGASACLVEADGAEAFGWPDTAALAALRGLKAASGPIADAWFGHPSAALRMLAVTGTNGKTSSAWWLAQLLSACGQRCGFSGTLGTGEVPVASPPPGADAPPRLPLQSTGLTTADPVTLHAALRQMHDHGLQACAMEASSIGLAEHRLDGLALHVALFTNLTQDHLDYHGTMAAYWQAKRRLFDWPGLQAAVVNLDDGHGAALAQELQARAAAPAGPGAGAGLALWTVSCRQPARLQARAIRHEGAGLAFEVVEDGGTAPGQVAEVRSPFVGGYNVSNLLGVLGGARALGVPLAQAARAVAGLGAVPGRLQRAGAPATAPAATPALPEVVVDYAHTPDALEQALQALRPLAQARAGRLWVVFGCGGNRDPGKRAPMGAIAARLADEVVLTSDNPRHEDPEAILRQIAAGVPEDRPARRIVDRRAAIAEAVARAAAADVVLLAGKGHEAEQEVAGTRFPLSDLHEAEAALALRARAGAAALRTEGARC